MIADKIYVCGHRKPDVDSVAAAYGMAQLRKRTMGSDKIIPISAGRLCKRSEWVFRHFRVAPPECRNDVYVRIEDLISLELPVLTDKITLHEALQILENSGESSLPVSTAEGKFLGMLSPIKLLPFFISGQPLTTLLAQVPLAATQTFEVGERVHDIKRLALKSPHNHFPILTNERLLVGTVLKRAFADEARAAIILVDHNETAQGIPGLEEIPVIEVVDHHRISFVSTPEPIKYTGDAVGSTCTVVARMFRGEGLRPDKATAGILLAGIVADTLCYQSPTTTEADRTMAGWLEKICGEKAEDLFAGMMGVASELSRMSVKEAIESDRKVYNESGCKFSLAQVEESNLAVFRKRIGELGTALDELIRAEGLAFAALMVTDPVRGNSELLYRGAETVRRALPWRRTSDGVFILRGILSRKKQLLPEILNSLN